MKWCPKCKGEYHHIYWGLDRWECLRCRHLHRIERGKKAKSEYE